MALISIITANPGQGKTEYTLRSTLGERRVILVPTIHDANKNLTSIPWISPQNLERIPEKNPLQFRILILAGSMPDVLAQLEDGYYSGCTFIFNDCVSLFSTPAAMNAFLNFENTIRHRNGKIVLNTQRIMGILDKTARTLADEIVAIGPIKNREEIFGLYQQSDSDNKAKFETDLRNNPQYAPFFVRKSLLKI